MRTVHMGRVAHGRHYVRLLAFALGLLLANLLNLTPAAAQDRPLPVVFMEPIESNPPKRPPTYRQITEPDRLDTCQGWLDNDAARWARDLLQRAQQAARKNPPAAAGAHPLYIALVPEGNHADAGFRLQTGDETTDHAQQLYIKLDPDPRSFGVTLLHETGHIILATLNGCDGIPRQPVATIPHSTATLSDRGTAFDEGFAIHLETLAAHLATDEDSRGRYHHERMSFGPTDKLRSEYFRAGADLLSYSQSLARYHEVRENTYAFAPAFRGPDYLRVQLEKSRDFATLRDANQLLQCEGFYATFFFACTLRGPRVPTRDVIRARQDRLLTVLAELFASTRLDANTPYLPRFIEVYAQRFPDDAGDVIDVLMDLSHGVFVDPDAPTLWREFYTAALRLDLKQLPTERIQTARERWRAAVLADPRILYSRLGPQLLCLVPARLVTLVALGGAKPLMFDLNTVEEGIIAMIPGISPEEVQRWLAERARAPFENADDFRQRCALRDDVLAELRF